MKKLSAKAISKIRELYEKWVRDEAGGEMANLALEYRNWGEVDLSGTYLNNVALSWAKLKEAKLQRGKPFRGKPCGGKLYGGKPQRGKTLTQKRRVKNGQIELRSIR